MPLLTQLYYDWFLPIRADTLSDFRGRIAADGPSSKHVRSGAEPLMNWLAKLDYKDCLKLFFRGLAIVSFWYGWPTNIHKLIFVDIADLTVNSVSDWHDSPGLFFGVSCRLWIHWDLLHMEVRGFDWDLCGRRGFPQQFLRCCYNRKPNVQALKERNYAKFKKTGIKLHSSP